MVLINFQDLVLVVYRAMEKNELETKHAFEEMTILCVRNVQYLN